MRQEFISPLPHPQLPNKLEGQDLCHNLNKAGGLYEKQQSINPHWLVVASKILSKKSCTSLDVQKPSK